MYMETLGEILAPTTTSPSTDEEREETMMFSVPFGNEKPPLITLQYLGKYALRKFDHHHQSSRMNLQNSTEDVG